MRNRLDALPDAVYRKIMLYLEDVPGDVARAAVAWQAESHVRFCARCGEAVCPRDDPWTVITNPLLLRRRVPDEVHCKTCFRMAYCS